MAKNAARKRSTNPKPATKREPKLEVVKDTPEQNPKRRRRKRRRNWGGRRKNMSTAGKIAVGVGIALVAVPLVVLAVGAVVVGTIATKTINDMPIPRTTPIPQPVPTPTPVYYGVGIPAQTVIHAGTH